MVEEERPITYGIVKPGHGCPGGVPVVKVKDMQDGAIDESNLLLTTPELDYQYRRSRLRTGDLLISIRGSVGRLAEIPESLENANITQDTARLTISPQYNKIYVRGVLESPILQWDMEKNIRGVAVKGINIGYLRELKMPVCSRERQDELAMLYQQSDKSKFISFKSQFIEMFGDPIENEKGWRTIPLLQTGKCKNGMNYSSKDCGVEMHCLGVADFQDNAVIDDMSVLPMVSLKERPNTDYLLQNGDIVFVRSNGNRALVGRSVVVYPGDEPVVYSGFCIRYRKEREELLTDYLLRFFKTDSVRAKMAGRGANIQNLNQQILAALNIPIPPIEMQKEFSVFVKQSDKSKFELKQAIEDINNLMRVFMAQNTDKED